MLRDKIRTILVRQFVLLLAIIASIEWLLMQVVDIYLESHGFSRDLRALVNAGLLILLCLPFIVFFQLSPLRMAYHDNLTGLPNRRLFDDRLRQAISYSRREGEGMAVIFIDLDRFKPINDSYGHRTGDEVLRLVGKRIAACVRESDTVARLSGDEFAIILKNIALENDAEKVVLKMAAEIGRSFEVAGRKLHIGMSAGIAFYPEHGGEGSILLNAADVAMYRAKKDGGLYCIANGSERLGTAQAC